MMNGNIKGNVLVNPEQRVVRISSGEEKTITELLIYVDQYTTNKTTGEIKQDEARCFRARVTFWQPNLAKLVFDHVRAGMRVTVAGDDIYLNHFKPNPEQTTKGSLEIIEMRVTGVDLAVNLNRIDSITMKSKNVQNEHGSGQATTENDIPF